MQFQTTLSDLRTFPGWQDAGETDDQPWTGEELVVCHSDGSVNFLDSGGVIVESCIDERDIEDTDGRWDALHDVPEDSQEWLLFLDQLAQREGGWL